MVHLGAVHIAAVAMHCIAAILMFNAEFDRQHPCQILLCKWMGPHHNHEPETWIAVVVWYCNVKLSFGNNKKSHTFLNACKPHFTVLWKAIPSRLLFFRGEVDTVASVKGSLVAVRYAEIKRLKQAIRRWYKRSLLPVKCSLTNDPNAKTAAHVNQPIDLYRIPKPIWG